MSWTEVPTCIGSGNERLRRRFKEPVREMRPLRAEGCFDRSPSRLRCHTLRSLAHRFRTESKSPRRRPSSPRRSTRFRSRWRSSSPPAPDGNRPRPPSVVFHGIHRFTLKGGVSGEHAQIHPPVDSRNEEGRIRFPAAQSFRKEGERGVESQRPAPLDSILFGRLGVGRHGTVIGGFSVPEWKR